MPVYVRGLTLEELQAGAGSGWLFHYADAIRPDEPARVSA